MTMLRLRIGFHEQYSGRQTHSVSATRRGAYRQVEVWCGGARYKVTFTKTLNLVSIHEFVRTGRLGPFADFHWSQRWHRRYKQKGRRTLSPLFVDLVVPARDACRRGVE